MDREAGIFDLYLLLDLVEILQVPLVGLEVPLVRPRSIELSRLEQVFLRNALENLLGWNRGG